MGELWNTIAVNPMFEVLKVFSVGGYLGLGIIFLTILVRIVIWPLTRRQLRATKTMQELQPKMAELQKKYGKDKQKLSEETMKLYKEAKINPLGCLIPMLIQLPIWIALFFAIRKILESPPPGMHTGFLWFDLTHSGDFGLAILVMASMWVLQKMSTVPSTDPRQQSMTRIMTVAMPLMFGIITLTLPGGLGLYFLVSNIIGIIMQYFVTGWGSLRMPAWLRRGARGANAPPTTSVTSVSEKHAENVELADKRQQLEKRRVDWGQILLPVWLWQKLRRVRTPITRTVLRKKGGKPRQLPVATLETGKEGGDGKHRSKRKDRRRSHRKRSK